MLIPPKQLITHSRAKLWRRCQQAHHFSYVLGRRALVEAQALTFGTHVHGALEAWFKVAMHFWESLPEEARAEHQIAAALERLEKIGDRYDRARARALVRAYHAKWIGEPLRPLAVEIQFRAPLVSPDGDAVHGEWEQGGKLDAVVLDLRDRRRRGVEHKTTGSDVAIGADYWRALRLDPQVTAYFEGAAAEGWPIDEMIYDVLKKPGIRPEKATPLEDRQYTVEKSKACHLCKAKSKNADTAPPPHVVEGRECHNGRIITDPGGRLYKGMRDADETPEEFEARCYEQITTRDFIQREPVVRLESQIERHRADRWEQVEQMRNEQHPIRNPDNCSGYGRACEYLTVCEGTARIDDDLIFRTVGPHAELQEQPQTEETP